MRKRIGKLQRQCRRAFWAANVSELPTSARNKHDAADAEAICEAVERPTMRFVPVKTAEQQATALLHRGREQLVRQRTMLVNALRAHLAEFGIVAAQPAQGRRADCHCSRRWRYAPA
jgi:transposase